jgi:hypothetical protein
MDRPEAGRSDGSFRAWPDSQRHFQRLSGGTEPRGSDGQPLEADVVTDVTSVSQSVIDDLAPLASQPQGVEVERIQDLVEMG